MPPDDVYVLKSVQLPCWLNKYLVAAFWSYNGHTNLIHKTQKYEKMHPYLKMRKWVQLDIIRLFLHVYIIYICAECISIYHTF